MKTIQLILLVLALSLSVVAQDQTINGKLFVNGDIEAKEKLIIKGKDASSISYISFANHYLNIGTIEGRYAHNIINLKPGGSIAGDLYSCLDMYWVNNKLEYSRTVRIHARGNSFINSGNVGIGTENPQALLDVRGKIIADEVEIKVNTGADFVFAENYSLKPLAEVAEFVKENKHLPEIPSEKEMQENGLNVNEFQIKLLQKIEELTLYVIEQDKRIESQNDMIRELQEKQ